MSNFDEPKLIIDVDGPVTTLTSNRPQAHNGSVDGRGFDYTGPNYRGWMAAADSTAERSNSCGVDGGR